MNPTTLHKILADLKGHYHCYLMIQFQIPKKANVCTCVMYSREKKLCIDQGPTDRAIIHARYIMMYQRQTSSWLTLQYHSFKIATSIDF